MSFTLLNSGVWAAIAVDFDKLPIVLLSSADSARPECRKFLTLLNNFAEQLQEILELIS